MRSRILRIVLFLLATIVVLLLCFVTTTDLASYKQQDFFHQTVNRLKQQAGEKDSQAISFKAGWAKVNITPTEVKYLAGYRIYREVEEGVKDSVYARGFVFEDGRHKVALLTVDLLIFPSLLKDSILSRMKSFGYTNENLYLSATHTHSGPGGWSGHVAGELISGGVDPHYLTFLTDKLCQLLLEAQAKQAQAEILFGKAYAPSLVQNRVKPDDSTDPWLRYLRVRKSSGEEAALVTFAAHANCLSATHDFISCDYPGVLARSLEMQGGLQMAAYFAGAVGSMKPSNFYGGLEDMRLMEFMGNKLAQLTMESSAKGAYQQRPALFSYYLPVDLGSPQLKISESLRLRPFIFNSLYGPYQAGLRVLKIGNVLMVGTPCDFSGQLMIPLEQYAEAKGLHLIVTSFNGEYIGYVISDEYYSRNTFEAQSMNWFGPETGSYFSELIRMIIDKHSAQ